MKLQKLELTNICQHRHIVLEFGTGLIGVYGPNGSGKSNAMNVGCYAGLTNDYSRHQLGKPGMICQQADEDESSAIDLWFEQDGHDYHILRGLRKPEKHVMSRPGMLDLRKANDIAVELEEVLGIKRRLIDDYIFVPQWELFAFLSATPASRAKSFSHLCNTTHAEKCWDLLGDQITADTPLADAAIDTSDEIRGLIGTYQARLSPLRKELADARKLLVTKTRENELQAVVDMRGRYTAITEELPALSRDDEEKRDAARVANSNWFDKKAALVPRVTEGKALVVLRDEAKRQFDEHAEAKTAATTELANVKHAAEQLTKKKAVVKKLAEATGLLEALVELAPVDEDARTALSEEAQTYAQRVRDAEHLLDHLDGDVAECPICSTPTDNLTDQLEAARQVLVEVPGVLNAVRETLGEIDDQKERIRTNEQARAVRAGRVETLTAELATYADVKPVKKGTTARCNKVLAEHKLMATNYDLAVEGVDHHKGLMTDLREELGQLETKKERLIATHQAAKTSLENKQAQLVKNEVNEDDFIAANAELAKHKAAQVKVAGHRARVEELDGFIAEKREELEEVKRRLARSARARHWVQILTEVRDGVMHRDKLPRIVHQNYLLDMVDSVNDSLAEFNAPFHVTATADVGFTAHFSNGTIMPAPGLSGGQKVVLALAFRLTINSIFAPQLGTMVLDEPTDGLDRENRQMAAEFFRDLGSVARSRGLQIVVITHDDEMERIFDQKVVLERPV